jgi:hypoxanthine phosphoribosyltransferase
MQSRRSGAPSPQPPDVAEIVFTREQIRRRVARLARQISEDYKGLELWLVTVLKGGAFFLVDLARQLDLAVAIDFLAISSYGPHARGTVRITKDLEQDISGRHVLVVEDIVDTGLTLGYICRALRVRRPASLEVCVLLDRPRRRIVDIDIRYRGFEAPDRFLVGYGLDWRQRYRNLPCIASVDIERLESSERKEAG